MMLVAVADNGAAALGRRPNPVACFLLTIP